MYARKLNKNPDHRIAMLKTLSFQLFEKGRIKTTFAKAKEVGVFSERLITKAKNDTLHNRRQILSKLKNKNIVKKLFEEIAISYKDRNGGYTRTIKIGMRRGDGAQMALVELVS